MFWGSEKNAKHWRVLHTSSEPCNIWGIQCNKGVHRRSNVRLEQALAYCLHSNLWKKKLTKHDSVLPDFYTQHEWWLIGCLLFVVTLLFKIIQILIRNTPYIWFYSILNVSFPIRQTRYVVTISKELMDSTKITTCDDTRGRGTCARTWPLWSYCELYKFSSVFAVAVAQFVKAFVPQAKDRGVELSRSWQT